MKRVFAFIGAVILMTGPFWAYALLTQCTTVQNDFSFFGVTTCNGLLGNYRLELFITLVWPFMIGAWLLLYSIGIFDEIKKQAEAGVR